MGHARALDKWKRRRGRWHDDGGLTSLELALVIPIFLLIVIGTFDFAHAVLLFNASSEAAREGARVGKVQVTPNPTPSAAPVLTAAQAAAITSAARDKAGPLGGQLRVTPVAGIDANGPFVQVAVMTTYEPVAGQFLGVGNIPVGASSKLYLP
jgi:Flp pilus assembly protein TadG